MNYQDGFTAVVALHIAMISALVSWVIISRAPAILHGPLTSVCAFFNGIVGLAGLYSLLQARTPLAQIAGFIILLFGTAAAVGGHTIASRSLAIFRVIDRPVVPADVGVAKQVGVRRTRGKGMVAPGAVKRRAGRKV